MRSVSGIVFSCAVLLSVAHAYSSRSFSQSQQNMQTLLNSIDERLRSLQLDKSSSYRHASAIDQHMRKLESLESRIERFESMLTARLDRIEANMSIQHFKDDLSQDQVLRKIDAIYERVHHKIFHIELKIDANERKMTEKLEVMFKKFQLMEETLGRRSEGEEEVAEVYDALDEMKTTWQAGVENVTRIIHREFSNLEGRVAPQENIRNLESIVNATRYEQQNAMRSLVVMVGRIGGKNSDCTDAANADDGAGGPLGEQLTDVARKIDARFDALIKQQGVFADSCHRIQSDEPQLESKISEILEKMIDVFEKESTVEIKDIQNIEQLIKSHDTSVRRSLYTTSHNMAVLLQKAKEHKDELALQVTAVLHAVDGLARRLNDTPPAIQDLANGSQVQAQLQVQVQKLLDQSIDRNDIRIISEALRNVSAQIDAFDVEALYKRIEVLLEQYAERDLDAAIQQVFTPPTNVTGLAGAEAGAGEGVIFAEIDSAGSNCTSGVLDVRMPVNCTICNTNTSTSSTLELTNCCCSDDGVAKSGNPTDELTPPDGAGGELLIDIRSESLDNTNTSLTVEEEDIATL